MFLYFPLQDQRASECQEHLQRNRDRSRWGIFQEVDDVDPLDTNHAYNLT